MEASRRTGMGSTTITIENQPNQASLQGPWIIRLSPAPFPFQEKIASIFEELSQSPLFSQDEEALNVWSSVLLRQDFSIQDLQKKKEIAKIISLFLLIVVRPKTDGPSVDVKDALKVLSFEKKIIEVLENALSRDTTVEDFIETVEDDLEDNQDERLYEEERSIMVLQEERLFETVLERFNSSPLSKLTWLLKQMEDSQLFDAFQAKMEEWREKFYEMNFNTEETFEKDDNALLLCGFLHEVIREARILTQDREKKLKIFPFEDGVRHILGEHILPIPPNATQEERKEAVSRFIAKIEGYFVDEKVTEEMYDIIQDSRERQRRLAAQEGNKTDRDMEEECRILKDKLIEAHEKRKLVSKEMFKIVDSSTEKTDRVSKEMKGNIEKTKAAYERMKQVQAEYLGLLKECRKIFKTFNEG